MPFLRPRLLVPVLVVGLLLAAAAVEVGLQRWVGHRAAEVAGCVLGNDVDVEARVAGLPGSVPVTWQVMAGTLDHVSVSGELPQGSFRLDLAQVPLDDGGAAPTATARVTVPWDELGGGDVVLGADGGGSVAALVAVGGTTVEVALGVEHDAHQVRLVPRSVAFGAMSLPVERLRTDGRAAGLLEPRVLEPELPDGTSITGVTAGEDGVRLDLAVEPSALTGGGC